MRASQTLLLISPMAESGGSDQALLRMARALVEEGFNVHLALPAQSPLAAEFEDAGATLHVVPMRRITTSAGPSWWMRYVLEWPVAVLRLVGLVRRHQVAVIASNSMHSWYGWAVAALTRRRHVWHAREIVVQSEAAIRLERRLAAWSANPLVSCSQAVDRQFQDVVPAQRRVVVHEDVDRRAFTPAIAGRFRARRVLGATTPLVGYVGRVDTWKGLDVLLHAWPEVSKTHPAARLIVAGGAVEGKLAYYEEVRAQASRLRGVEWLGPIAQTEVAEVMADLDVLVAPSTLPEPYGLTLVEALASGARVVTSDAGGAPEILGLAERGAGRLVPPSDAGALSDAINDLLPRREQQRVPLLQPLPYSWSMIYGNGWGGGAS